MKKILSLCAFMVLILMGCGVPSESDIDKRVEKKIDEKLAEFEKRIERVIAEAIKRAREEEQEATVKERDRMFENWKDKATTTYESKHGKRLLNGGEKNSPPKK